MRDRCTRTTLVILMGVLLALPILAAENQDDAVVRGGKALEAMSMPQIETRTPVTSEWRAHGQDWWPFEAKAPYTSFHDRNVPDLDLVQIDDILEIDVTRPDVSLSKLPAELREARGEAAGDGYYLIKYRGPVYQIWRDELQAKGVRLYHNYKWYTEVAWIPAGMETWVQNLPFVRWVGRFEPAYRISSQIGTALHPEALVYPGAPIQLDVEAFPGEDRQVLGTFLQSYGCQILESDESSWGILFHVAVQPEMITRIATLEGVRMIHEHTEKISHHGANGDEEQPVTWENGAYVASGGRVYTDAGIDGTGQLMAMMDSGLAVSSAFFANTTAAAGTPGASHRQVRAYGSYGGGDLCHCADSTPEYSHGTNTTNCAIGEIGTFGFGPYDFGLAVGTKVVFQDVSPLSSCGTGGMSPPTVLTTSMSDLVGVGCYIQNHSWGSTSNSYSSHASQIDAFLKSNNDFFVSVSQGNLGFSSEDGSMGEPATAKNSIGAGGTDSDPNHAYLYSDGSSVGSGRGPVASSGRVKPDVCFTMGDSAGQTGNVSDENMPGPVYPTSQECSPWSSAPVLSFYPSTGFAGTSFSSPFICGAAAQIRGYFVDGWYPTGATGNPSVTPSGMALKAALIASAENLNTTDSPNGAAVARRYSSDVGYGRIQLNNLLPLASPATGPSALVLEDNVSLTTGSTQPYTINVLGTAEPIKIALAWYDNSGNSLDIDYNLTVTQGANTWRGNNFAATGWSATGGTADATNTTEAVFLDAGQMAAGSMDISIYAQNAPSGDSPTFALVMVGDIAAGQTFAGSLDKAVYHCADTVCGTITDTEGTPTNAYYNTTTGGAVGPVTISGGPTTFTVECRDISTLGGADGDNVWMTWTDSQSNGQSTSNSTVDCSLQVCLLYDGYSTISGGCDNDPYNDEGEVLNYELAIVNLEAYALPTDFTATLQLRDSNTDVGIYDPGTGTWGYGAAATATLTYPALDTMTYATNVFTVRYDGPLSNCGPPAVTTLFEVVDIQSTTAGAWASDAAGCTGAGYDHQFDVDANWDAGEELLSEGFESGIPATWDNYDYGGDCIWSLGPSVTGRTNNTGSAGGGDAADANSDFCGAGTTMDTALRTPVQDMSGYGSGASLSLEFDHIITDYYTSTNGYVQYSTTGWGTTWTTIDSWLAGTCTGGCTMDGPARKVYDLSSLHGGSANFAVQWRYDSNGWNLYWQIDDVLLLAGDPGCETEVCTSAPDLIYDQYMWDENDPCQSGGNPSVDGYIDPGEEGILSVYIDNVGNDIAYGTTAVLACTSHSAPDVQICDGTAVYGDVPFGDSYVYAPLLTGDTFEVAFDENLACGTQVDFTVTLNATNPYGPVVRAFSLNLGSLTSVEGFRYEDHGAVDPETASNATDRPGDTSAWTVSAANRTYNAGTNPSDCTCGTCVMDHPDTVNSNHWYTRSAVTIRKLFDTTSIANGDNIYMEWEWDVGDGNTDDSITLQFTNNGLSYNDITATNSPGDGSGIGNNWQCWSGSLYYTVEAEYGTTVADAMGNNSNFGIGYNIDAGGFQDYFQIDNMALIGYMDEYVCNTVANCLGECGGCVDPSTPTIDDITDNDACAQSGITITFTGGTPSTSHVLVDNGVEQGAVTSPYVYDPGDTASHNYIIRTYNTGACWTDSGVTAFTDVDDSVGSMAAPGFSDDDACAQSGVTITFGTATGATSYELRVDGGAPFAAASPYSYDPGDTAGHDYEVRGVNANCSGAWSPATAGTDVDGSVGVPVITAVDDFDGTCSIRVTYTAGTAATTHDLWVDGIEVATDVANPCFYSPGDTNSHNYQIEANNACGSELSTIQAGSDADCGGGAPPGETAPGTGGMTSGITWSATDTIDWPVNGDATAYYLYRGLQAELSALLDGTTDFCTLYDGATNQATDAADPGAVAGDCYYYIVTGYNGFGEGPAGNATAGARSVDTSGVCP